MRRDLSRRTWTQVCMYAHIVYCTYTHTHIIYKHIHYTYIHTHIYKVYKHFEYTATDRNEEGFVLAAGHRICNTRHRRQVACIPNKQMYVKKMYVTKQKCLYIILGTGDRMSGCIHIHTIYTCVDIVVLL